MFLQLCGRLKDDMLEDCNLHTKMFPEAIPNVIAVLPTLALPISDVEVTNSYGKS